MSNIQLMITVSREQQISIEEHCINVSLSMSEYLMMLHELFVKSRPKHSVEEEIEKEQHEAFERQLEEGVHKKIISDETKKKKPSK